MAGMQELLSQGLVVAPAVGDALGALLVAEAGFQAVSISGYQVAATLGYPDVGLVTMSEMVERATQIAEVSGVPVISDADTGYGNAVNVTRTVRALERAGIAAIHLEDQIFPKKCGAMTGHSLVSEDEMVGKIKAVVDTRRSSDFLVFARTDAISTDGIEAAIRRSQAYRKAGASGIMVMAPRSVDDLIRFRRDVEGPLMVTIGSWKFQCSVRELDGMGYNVVLYPLSLMRRAISAMREVLQELRVKGEVDHGPERMVSIEALHDLLGLGRIRDLESRYGVGAATGRP